jgi:hypothetical protein
MMKKVPAGGVLVMIKTPAVKTVLPTLCAHHAIEAVS